MGQDVCDACQRIWKSRSPVASTAHTYQTSCPPCMTFHLAHRPRDKFVGAIWEPAPTHLVFDNGPHKGETIGEIEKREFKATQKDKLDGPQQRKTSPGHSETSQTESENNKPIGQCLFGSSRLVGSGVKGTGESENEWIKS